MGLYDALFAPLAGRAAVFMTLQDGTTITGAQFHDHLSRLAAALRAQGVAKGDRVAVQSAKSAAALALYAATVSIGAVYLPLNPAYTATEVEYFIGNAQPVLFFCDPSQAAALAPMVQVYGTRIETLAADGTCSLPVGEIDLPLGFLPTPCDSDDLAAILYTSGTTGRSKGAMLTHGNLLSNAQVLAQLWHFTPQDVLLHALPIFHTHGLFVATNTVLAAGASMVFLPGFDPRAVLAALPQCSVMMGVPTFYTRLLDSPDFTRAVAGHMRLFISGSAPLLAETHAAFAARTGHAILERYGMTETNMNTSNPHDGARRAGTVGMALPGVDLRITENRAAVPPGTVGMIEVRGPNVFAGYWQMPEKTAEDLSPDGWFTTGDLGLIDDLGYLQIVGRAKDLIISGGFNVYPKEVELLLDASDGVLESAVIGLPHPDFGEAVFAVLVAQKGVALDAATVLAGLSGRLARFKQPKAAVVVADLPRNAMGKVQKADLRKVYASWFSRSSKSP
jgi:malonyl-CoA/methylmalonyl-CoA synthetase